MMMTMTDDISENDGDSVRDVDGHDYDDGSNDNESL
jgi:hypothetical protein